MLNLPRLAIAGLVAATLSGCGSLSTFEGMLTPGGELAAKQAPATGKAYVFRGMGGRFASFEMDYLRDKIAASGIEAETYNHINWYGPAREAIARYKKNPQPIMAMGHSAGGDAALAFAWKLKDAGVPVSLIVAFDPTRKAPNVPNNVDRFINIYQSLNFFGGGYIRASQDFRGHFSTIDLKNYWEVLHVNMVKIRGLQDKIVAKVVQISTLPVQLEGPTVPIRYIMPRGETIELWDSGVAVRAEPGDTVRMLAQRYAAPAWAVAQLNDLNANAALEPGQRLIVPRHLEAAQIGGAPLTSYAPLPH
jgi:pimeloyl-ACP methyl ester carboxylesterase